MTDDPSNDLDWQAFRYIAAEMSPSEMTRFEERLADEQLAREAVSRATELADAVAVTSAEFSGSGSLETAQPAAAARSNWGRRLGWGVVGAAAALAGVLLWHVLPVGNQSERPREEGDLLEFARGAAADLNNPRFALLWCQTRDEMAQSESDLWPVELPDSSVDADDPTTGLAAEAAVDLVDHNADPPSDDAESGEVLPSWMLVAVAGEMDSVGGNGDLRLEN